MVARETQLKDPELLAQLLIARRGLAYFSRKVNELKWSEWDEPSLLPGWNRRTLIAHVGLNARANRRLVEWAETGKVTPMYDSPTQREDEIDFYGTLNIPAILNLHWHASVDLDVAWRDLPNERWSHEIKTAQGRSVPVSETLWMRIREVWIHAVDIDNGGDIGDFPLWVVDRLLPDIISVWKRRRSEVEIPNIVLAPTDRDQRWMMDEGQPEDLIVSGTAVDVVRWGLGRGTRGVLDQNGQVPPKAPRWL